MSHQQRNSQSIKQPHGPSHQTRVQPKLTKQNHHHAKHLSKNRQYSSPDRLHQFAKITKKENFKKPKILRTKCPSAMAFQNTSPRKVCEFHHARIPKTQFSKPHKTRLNRQKTTPNQVKTAQNASKRAKPKIKKRPESGRFKHIFQYNRIHHPT